MENANYLAWEQVNKKAKINNKNVRAGRKLHKREWTVNSVKSEKFNISTW